MPDKLNFKVKFPLRSYLVSSDHCECNAPHHCVSGYFCSRCQQVFIDTTINTGEHRKEILLHELLHICLYEMGANAFESELHEETHTQSLAALLTFMIRNNPNLVKDLLDA